MGDVDQITADLEKFCSTQEKQSQEFASPSKFDNIPESLDAILQSIAKNGQLPYSFEWKRVSLVVRQKILYCINEMNSKAKYNGSADDYLESCDLVLKRIEMFTEAPFTLQRLCELVLMPDKYYNDTNKYIHALLKCLLVVSGWRKQTDPDLPKIEDSQAEPDSTSEKVSKAESKVEEPENNEQPQPDSTTVDTPAKEENITEEEIKDEPVFKERPKSEQEDDGEGGIFSRQKSPIKTSPVKRKVQISTSNIKLNVGTGKAEPNTPEPSETTPQESEEKPQDSETDEEKRKRKRSVDNEESDELNSEASTPQKQQKTE